MPVALGGRPAALRAGAWLEIGLFSRARRRALRALPLVPGRPGRHYSLYSWNGLGELTDFVGLDNYREAFGRRLPPARGTTRSSSRSRSLPAAARARRRATPQPAAAGPHAAARLLRALRPVRGDHGRDLPSDPPARRPRRRVPRTIGLGGLVQLWLADLELVFFTLFVVITWKYIGFAIILFLAGLQGVPGELHEAAAIDGASAGAPAVTLPLLGPTIRIWVFLAVIGSIQLFDIVWIMTLGGPAGASTTMATYMVDHGFRSYQIGYGSAVAVILFGVCFVFSILYQLFVLRRDVAGALTGMAGEPAR